MNRPHHRLLKLACVLCALITLQSCARFGTTNNNAAATATTEKRITVAAAANLTDAFNELGQQFTARTGVRVVYSFGATADLAKQIEQGAPFDVYAAADVEHVDELLKQNLLTPDTRVVYARGRLVLWVPPGGRADVQKVEDLTGAGVTKIAVAKPDVAPYGRAAVEALRALKLWQQIEPKMVYGQNVTQAKQFAASGNAEAAFIPRALVKANEGHAIEIDARLHQPIDQALGVVRASPRQEPARQFAQFVLSAEGQALLERYGYEKPPR